MKLYIRKINNGYPTTDYIIIGALTTFITDKETLKVTSVPTEPGHLCIFPKQSIEQINIVDFLRNTKMRGVWHILVDVFAIRTRVRRFVSKYWRLLFPKGQEEDEFADAPFNHIVVTHPTSQQIVRTKTDEAPTLLTDRDKKDKDGHRNEEDR